MVPQRVRLRTLLVIVALAGLALGAERLWRRSRHFRKLAAICEFTEKQCRYLDRQEAAKGVGSFPEPFREETERYAALKERYRRLASFPWERLPADTPELVRGYDLDRLSAEEIEALVRDMMDDAD